MENIEKRLAEIEARLTEIRDILTKDEEVEDIEAVEEEVRKLNAEREELRSKQALANKITVGKVETRTIAKPENKKVENMENNNIFGSAEYRSAFKNFIIKGEPVNAEFRDAAAPLTHTGVAGSVIPTTVINTVVSKLRDYGKILPLVTVTHYSSNVSVPVTDLLPEASWIAETSRTEDGVQVTTSSVNFAAYQLKMRFVTSLQMDAMSIDAFEAFLADKLVEGLTVALEKAILNGTGVNQATGILTAAADTAVATAMATEGRALTASALDYDTIIGLEGALPSAYDGDAVYVMNKKTFLALRGVKDDNKRPVVDNLDVMAKEILGRKVVICDLLPAFSAASVGDPVVILYNFKDYIVNFAYDVQVREYYDELYDQPIKKIISLVDGKPVSLHSLVVLKKA